MYGMLFLDTPVLLMKEQFGTTASFSVLSVICDGTFEEMDFLFTIGGDQFDKLRMLVNGFYPQLSHFVKPGSVLIGEEEA
jgi:hypothetical protein